MSLLVRVPLTDSSDSDTSPNVHHAFAGPGDSLNAVKEVWSPRWLTGQLTPTGRSNIAVPPQPTNTLPHEPVNHGIIRTTTQYKRQGNSTKKRLITIFTIS